MKKLIHEIPETSGSKYQLWAELIPCYHPSDCKTLAFSSVWTGAKNPNEHQNKWQVMLAPDAIKNLIELLESNE
jgi:hypothetical protein